MKTSRDKEKQRADPLQTELDDIRRSYNESLDEIVSMKAEVRKGVEEVAGALGEGYARCLDRVSKTGFDPSGHAFEDSIRDYVATRASENPPPENP